MVALMRCKASTNCYHHTTKIIIYAINHAAINCAVNHAVNYINATVNCVVNCTVNEKQSADEK